MKLSDIDAAPQGKLKLSDIPPEPAAPRSEGKKGTTFWKALKT